MEVYANTPRLTWMAEGRNAGKARTLNLVVAGTAIQTNDNACLTGHVGQRLGVDQPNITRPCGRNWRAA